MYICSKINFPHQFARDSAALEIKWAILYLSSCKSRILSYLTPASRHGVIFNGHKSFWHFLFIINANSMLYDPYMSLDK